MTKLSFDGAAAVMRKISINVLGKNAEHTLFTLPLEGIELSRKELNTILGDRTFEAWYYQKPDGSWHPMDYWRLRKNGDFAIDDEFTSDALTITVSGDKEIEFETEEADEDDPDSEEVPAAKLHSLVFKPTAGGVTLLSLHMQVRPGMDRDNLQLQKHQYRPVKITLGEATRKERKSQQGELGFAKDNSGEADSKTQAAAATAKPNEVIDGRSERVKQQDRTRNGGRTGAH